MADGCIVCGCYVSLASFHLLHPTSSVLRFYDVDYVKSPVISFQF